MTVEDVIRTHTQAFYRALKARDFDALSKMYSDETKGRWFGALVFHPVVAEHTARAFGGPGTVVKNHEKSAADEIADIRTKRPHVVLLGAGASRAASPLGERNGKRLPVMADFFETAPIAEALASEGTS